PCSCTINGRLRLFFNGSVTFASIGTPSNVFTRLSVDPSQNRTFDCTVQSSFPKGCTTLSAFAAGGATTANTATTAAPSHHLELLIFQPPTRSANPRCPPQGAGTNLVLQSWPGRYPSSGAGSAGPEPMAPKRRQRPAGRI